MAAMETTNRHDTSGVTPENMAVAFAHTDTQTRFKVHDGARDHLQEREWRNVQKRYDRSRYDIFGSLPIELVVLVTAYLEPWDTVRNQRVSKRWHFMLSSDPVISSALRRTVADLDLKSKEISAAEPVTYFRWRQSLAYARPVKKYFLRYLEGRNIEAIQYRSRRLVWKDKADDDIVWSLDLGSTSLVETWQTAMGAPVNKFKLSNCCLILTSTDGYATAWDLVGSGKRALKLPFNRATPEILIEGYRVIMFLWQSAIKSPVIVWNVSLDDVRAIGEFENVWLAHFDPNEKLLDVFTICDDAAPIQLEQTKWTMTGTKFDTRQVRPSQQGRRVVWRDLGSSLNQRTHLYSREKVTEFLSWNDNSEMLHVTYDRVMDKLGAQWVNAPENLWQDPRLSGTNVSLTHSIVYGLVESRKIFIFNAADATRTVLTYQVDEREIGRDKFPLMTFGDHEVFGVVGSIGTQLWCFNPDFVTINCCYGTDDFVEMEW